jgi:hypothetical protein
MRRDQVLKYQRYLAEKLRCEVCNHPGLDVSGVVYGVPILFCQWCRQIAEKDQDQKKRRHEFFRHIYSLEI